MKKSCAVIGAGIAGMAVAIRLRKLGYQVDVYERRSSPGGKMSEIRMGDYRFDCGPTVLTMPWLIDELFSMHGKDPRKYFNYQRLDQPVRYFFQDGTIVNANSDLEVYARELNEKLGVPERSFKKYLKDARTKFDLTNEVFLQGSLQKMRNYTRWIAIKGILLFHKVGVFKSMNQRNRQFFRNEKMLSIVNRYAQYNGSDPYKMPSTFNVIANVELEKGVYAPEGGMYRIIDALYQLSIEIGVNFHFNAEIEELILDEDIVMFLKVQDYKLPYDVFVCNADKDFVYQKLIKELDVPGRKQNEKSSSSVIFHWAIDKEYAELNTHNFFMGSDTKAEFTDIFDHLKMPDDGTIYLNISKSYSDQDAPSGCQNWFVMLNAPNDSGQNWKQIVQEQKSHIVSRISEHLKEDISAHIVHETVTTPDKIANMFMTAKGAIYGDSSNEMMAALRRHPNFSKKLKNLFFAGGSYHPGAGIPLCLYSAQVSAMLIEKGIKR